ncbi:hypothetical protein FB45DRAFT_907955 [Roridomyces roridus]|uniref:Uncharacterized protein n=1 Tax=Roridomyces roridus TaxID=1738132 RepID=A0AAD7FQG1_9AGAR|nr:hypothetical protein FB45DRAFT_907955 [Roridomyces roridus]
MSIPLPWAARVAHDNAALQQGIRLVRKVIARDATKMGLTTTQIYKLALREPPPPSFALTIPAESEESSKGTRYARTGRKRIPPPEPPHPRHPVRSISFLKHHILPRIQGERYVQHVRETRTIVQSPAKRGAPKPSKSATSDNEKTVWLWRAARPPAQRESTPAPPRPIVYDFSHMKPSKRKAHVARLELAEDRKKLEDRRAQVKAKARREAQVDVLKKQRESARARHEAAEKAALAEKARKRKEWEEKNPQLARMLAKQRADAEKKEKARLVVH